VLRLIVRTVIALAANAVGLIVAAAVLDGMSLDVTGFVVAVVVFTLSSRSSNRSWRCSSVARRGRSSAVWR